MNIQVSSERWTDADVIMKRTAEVTPNTTPSKIKPWAEQTTPDKSRGPMIGPLKASPTKQIQKRNVKTEAIKTYVFFDLECTGLIKSFDKRITPFETSDEYSTFLNNMCVSTRSDELPCITEMSFVAIARETFDDYKEERKNLVQWNEKNPEKKKELAKFIPTNTHTRQLNPVMSENKWDAYTRERRGKEKVLVFGRAQLERNNTFKDEWPAVVDFLDSLQKPALLIAHKGLDYDLPVIFGEMSRFELREKFPIPAGVYFMDSLLMARHVEDNIEKKLGTICKYIKFPEIPSNDVNIDTAEDVFNDSMDSTVQEDIPPIRKPTMINGVLARDHPANILNFDEFSVAVRRRISNSGFYRTADGWSYRHNRNNRHSLQTLYEDVVGGAMYNAHYAQPDAEALMHVCLSYGDDFSQFAEKFAAAVPF